MVIAKAVAIWVALVGVAIGNGTFRVAVLNGRLGELRAHQISSVTGSALILLATMAMISWLGVSSTKGLLGIGALWLALTVGFEFGFGHYVAGHPWDRLLADYNLLKGRLWVLVLAMALLAPLLAARLRGI